MLPNGRVQRAVHQSRSLRVLNTKSEPVLKLEVMSRRSINGLSYLLFFTILWNIVAVIELPLVFSPSSSIWTINYSNDTLPINPNSTKDPHLTDGTVIRAFIIINGVTYTLATCILFFLLLAYPQRIIVRACGCSSHCQNKKPLTQQVVLILLILLMGFSPSFTVYLGAANYWSTYSSFVDFFNQLSSYLAVSEPSGYWDNRLESFVFSVFLFSSQDTGSFFNFGFATITLIFFWLTLLNTYKLNTKLLLPKIKVVNNTASASEVNEQEVDYSYSCSQRLKDIWRILKTFAKTCFHCVFDIGLCCCSCYYICCCFLCCKRDDCASQTTIIGIIRRGFAWKYFNMLLLYGIYTAVAGSILEYSPSIIPFVSIITLLRVCFKSDVDGVSYCDQTKYNIGFQRAMVIIGGSVMECFLAWFFWRAKRQAKNTLNKISYTQNRSNYLGYIYTQGTAYFLAVSTLFYSILLVSIPPVQFWYVFLQVNFDSGFLDGPSSDDNETISDFLNNITTYGINPLWQVGVTSMNPGFAFLFLTVAVWMFLVTYGHLPSDSVGFFGWWASAKDVNLLGLTQNTQENFEQPHYVQSEDLVFINHSVLDSSYASSIEMTAFTDGASSAEIVPESDVIRHEIMAQMASNVLVLETELLMLNFAQLSYKIDDPALLANNTPKSSLIQDPKYKLVEHVIHEESDTNVVIAYSEDRVILAFRGTVSKLNMKTDLDLGLEILDLHRPDPETLHRISKDQNLFEKNLEPKYHTGFLKAYASVKSRIHELIDHLVLNSGHQIRAVFITGHSLGGGLANICAYDIAVMILNITKKKPFVQCTTFGCPRVCSLGFKFLFESLVCASRRVVLKGDPITKTPPKWALCSSGDAYFHVGLELLLDLQGNMMIGPSLIEKSLFHGFSSLETAMHYLSRYTLGLLLLSVRVHGYQYDPPVWPLVINLMLKFSGKHLKRCDKDLLQLAFRVFLKEGVVYGKYRSVGAQTEFEIRIVDKVETDPLLMELSDQESEATISSQDTMKHVFELALNGNIIDQDQYAKLIQLCQN